MLNLKRRCKGLIPTIHFFLIFILLINQIDASNASTTLKIPKTDPIENEDVTISISKNATGIGPHSSLEFIVTVTNTLSESVHNIKGFASQESPYIELDPSGLQVYSTETLEPEGTDDFTVVGRIIGEITSNPVDILLMIDASGSMGEEIASVQAKLTSMTDTLSKEIPELRMGVIVYGWAEYSEYPMSNPGNYIEFTSDFNAIKDFIDSLYPQGGDEPWGDALYLANTWDWRAAAQKLIIMVGDEDCDPGNVVGRNAGGGFYNGSELVDVVTDLKEKGVIINTVVTDNPRENVIDQFGWISTYTEGESVSLPELEKQGIDLPSIIEEWTLELGREYSQDLNVTITWEDGSGTLYRNSEDESFWLDTTFPSIIVSEQISATGIDLFSVEILAEATDFSEILYVTLYHNAYGSWEVVSMESLPNSSYYVAELSNVPGQYNLSYFIEASDILHNVGATANQWVIVEPISVSVGEENTLLAEAGDQIFTTLDTDETKSHYLVISGESVIDSIIVNIVYSGTSEAYIPTTFYYQNVTNELWRKIFPLDLSQGVHTLNMTIPFNSNNFTFSYVWITLGGVSGDSYQGSMTEDFRVKGLRWFASNGTYFEVDYDPSSPLVVLGEVYSTDWSFLGQFSVNDDYAITKNDTYFVIIWATLRTGDYAILLSTEPTDVTDPYHNGEDIAAISSGLLIPIIGLGFLVFLSHNLRKRK
ncbi:MAG: VWA domain-containing protein [Candidatus Heimdallarchaeota archaeon]|nr:MAG: VWA domain-containing protein [Candidatus Heimdallarchaeota archaeon]